MDLRVLTFSWEYPPVIAGGLGRHVAGLSRELATQGTEVHVLTRGAPVVARVDGVGVHRVDVAPFPADLDAFLAWVMALNVALDRLAGELTAATSFDLIHSHDWLVAVAARRTARRLGIPWLVTVHATEHGRHGGWVSGHPQSTIHAAERAMARDADHLITCSVYMADHVSDVFGVPRERISALRNGIATGDPVAGDLRAFRERFASPRQRLILLAGRLVHEKGFHLALQALAPLIHARGDVRFVIAGSGPAAGDLRRQVRRLGLQHAGTFAGWVDDLVLQSLYRTADLCLVPSTYEPFGIVALEAMASGCPCLVADTGGLREVVPGDRAEDLSFPAGDAVALRGLVQRMLDDDGLRAGAAAASREHALRFDWARVACDTREIYAQLTRRAVSEAAAPGGPPSR